MVITLVCIELPTVEVRPPAQDIAAEFSVKVIDLVSPSVKTTVDVCVAVAQAVCKVAVVAPADTFAVKLNVVPAKGTCHVREVLPLVKRQFLVSPSENVTVMVFVGNAQATASVADTSPTTGAEVR